MCNERVATLIYNPHAGPANRLAVLRQVADLWKQRGWLIHLRPTRGAGDAQTLAREAALAGQRVVVVAGGDGTLSEAANGLVGTDTILAALPTGTRKLTGEGVEAAAAVVGSVAGVAIFGRNPSKWHRTIGRPHALSKQTLWLAVGWGRRRIICG